MFATLIPLPTLMVPAAPLFTPKTALPGVVLSQATSVLPFHQSVVVVSQLPAPSWAPVVPVLPSKVSVAADAKGTTASWASKARTTRVNSFDVCRRVQIVDLHIKPRRRAV